ncbi:MAG: thioredoxin domain-containing protein [Chlamydiales bacterium]|nr:thioredoxin domain-containing protein [Chlamydiales bacterium]
MTEKALSSHQDSFFKKYSHGAVGILLVLGLILSFMSLWHVCSTACAEGHKYRMFGLHFEAFGIAFFVASIVSYFLAFRFPRFDTLFKLLVAGALGAEIRFLYVQKYIIGSWCPLCVTIAATVAVIGLILVIQSFTTPRWAINNEERRNITMKNIMNSIGSLAVGLVGFMVALVGIAKVEHSFADTNTRGENPAFGNAKSNVEVYFFTDWFCPACRKTEPELEKQLPSIFAKARFYFIDVPIHEDSLNFLPYNLSFMLKNKSEYMKLRKGLNEIASKEHTPAEADVEAMAGKVGVKYAQLDFAEINQGLKYFKKMADKYSVDSTPTLVITNTKTKKAKKLAGFNQITQANITHIIDQLK